MMKERVHVGDADRRNLKGGAAQHAALTRNVPIAQNLTSGEPTSSRLQGGSPQRKVALMPDRDHDLLPNHLFPIDRWQCQPFSKGAASLYLCRPSGDGGPI